MSWFEEPVSSDDLEGLRLLRDRAPAGMAIAAGEYGYDAVYFARMLAAGAVDVLQADVTRCGGITELLRVGGLCRGHQRAALAALRAGDPRPSRRARSTGSCTSSTSTTTPGSRSCSSTACSSRATAACAPTWRGPATGSSSSGGRRAVRRLRNDATKEAR